MAMGRGRPHSRAQVGVLALVCMRCDVPRFPVVLLRCTSCLFYLILGSSRVELVRNSYFHVGPVAGRVSFQGFNARCVGGPA